MKPFLNKDFLLSNDISKKLYHEYACNMPIIDYHCHINPKEIAENKTFKNMTEVWLGGDHYKWRQMRSNGVAEKYITGDATDYEKFEKYAETLEKAIGNPLYHWSHLELKEYFGYEGTLSRKTAKEVWNLCNEKLATMSVLDIIKQSNVTAIGTTDDPIDDLKWHKQIAEDDSIEVKVVPSFRPDKAMNMEFTTYLPYLKELEKACGFTISSFEELKKALSSRIDFFDSMGCRASDHGIDYIFHENASDVEIENIFNNRLNDVMPSAKELEQFKTACMVFVAKEYNKKNWVMQLHYGCKRNNNLAMFEKLGPDTGFDCINNYAPAAKIADYLNAVGTELPKTIIYSLNPSDDATIGTIIGCFQEEYGVCGKIQHGSAWWFNDTKQGMINQMTSLANLGLLGNFVGMLTDSRSFLSYTRHEYFRRILCELIGTWVNNGEFPEDYEILETIIKGISYNNAKAYFNL